MRRRLGGAWAAILSSSNRETILLIPVRAAYFVSTVGHLRDKSASMTKWRQHDAAE